MKHQIYGGSNFPFMTGFNLSAGARWKVMAILLSPVVAAIAGAAALIWWLV